MWIDMFPILHETRSHFKPVDIAIRKPKKFQLRVTIYNAKDVILDDTNPLTGQKSSDIYFKGFICDRQAEFQKTDVHYRSLDGEGMFNWRFIFNFEYLPAEQKIVYSQKEKLGFVTIERKMKPKITIQCQDWDQITADDQLGEIELNLCSFMRGALTPERCTSKMLADEKSRDTNSHINLFKKRKYRGWWPLKAIDSNTGKATNKLGGKFEAEFVILSEAEALEQPAGLGRSAPDPLPEPKRPDESFLWLTSPMRTFRHVIWKQYWKQIILLSVFGLFLGIIVMIILQLPSSLATAFIG